MALLNQGNKALKQTASLQEWVRRLAVTFLIVQGAGIIVWWAVLLLVPAVRTPFIAPGAPDSTLFAFIVADILVYVATSFASAYGLVRVRSWAWPVLCVHAGAVVYAGLYAIGLPLVSGGGWFGTAFMLPSLVIVPLFTWLLRPGNST